MPDPILPDFSVDFKNMTKREIMIAIGQDSGDFLQNSSQVDFNTNLFGGDETLNGEYYQFYIQQGDAADGGYIACGEDKVDSSKIYKINAYNKTTNF